MYHSINFGSKNTWDDWHLIPSSRPLFNLPPVKTRFIEIPGAHGQLNMATIGITRKVFGSRTGSLEFVVANGYLSWEVTYSNIMNYLHGKKMDAVLEDDPDYYYRGIFYVNQWQSAKSFSIITIDYVLDPYKLQTLGEGADWLWDPFNFDFGVLADRSFENIIVNGSKDMILFGDAQPTSPRIIASAATMSVVFKGVTHSLNAGLNVIPSLLIMQGSNVLTFTGQGSITIEYRGGSL